MKYLLFVPFIITGMGILFLLSYTLYLAWIDSYRAMGLWAFPIWIFGLSALFTWIYVMEKSG